jgi:hypothetical protein
MSKVSVIIVTRNTCQMTCAAIESVLNSRHEVGQEVLLVDNGSTDDTAVVVAERFPAVRYLRAKGNLGFARAVNWAAREARGQFLLLLNSDAAVRPDSIGTAVEWMQAHPDCAVTGAQLLNPDGSRQNSIASFPTLATELLNKSLLRWLWPRKFLGKEQHFSEPVEVETVVGAFFLVRREVWDALCGLDERYFFFMEETDFCVAAWRAGFRVMHLPQVEVQHGQGQTAKQVSASARIEYWRSRYAYFRKWHGLLACGVLLVGLLVRLAVNTLASTLLTVLTAGQSDHWRHKCAVSWALCGWHLRGCPVRIGLPR